MPHVAKLLTARGKDFVTLAEPALTLTLEGIAGDRHAGAWREADARTPWHRRGARIANTRQVSIVSVEECAEIAALLGLPAVDPALLGANLVLEGLPGLSLAMPSTRLLFPSGAAIFLTEQNTPCRRPARELASAHGDARIAAGFARAAAGRRGLVGIVEREGEVAVGDAVRRLAPPARVAAPTMKIERASA